MKLTYSIFFLALLLVEPADLSSQCNQTETEQKEHGWSRIDDASTSHVAPSLLPKQQQTVQKISEIMKAFYPKPKGAEISWYGNYFVRKIVNQYPNSYDAEIILQNYKCINNKEVRLSYNSSVFVGVNSLTFMSSDLDMNGKSYVTLRALFTKKDGYIYYIFDENDKYKREEEYIITYPDKLPFTYMTRKEYITEARADQAKIYEAKTAELKKNYKVRPKAEQEAERQKMIDGFKKSYQGNALTARIDQYNRDYKTDEQRLDEALKFNTSFYEKILSKYNVFLASQSEEYLSQPAIVLPYTRENFDGFEKNRNDKNLVYIIKDNPEYYNRNLPVSAPQYFSVLIRHSLGAVQDKMFYEAINKKELLDDLYGLLQANQ